MYGSKVALMKFGEDEVMCVVIEDMDIVNTLRDAWQKLWDVLHAPTIG